jgi:hypothetical protein
MFHMFQADPPPIIRSSKTVHTASGFFRTYTATCRYRGRAETESNVEYFAEINELYNIASCWLCLGIYV